MICPLPEDGQTRAKRRDRENVTVVVLVAQVCLSDLMNCVAHQAPLSMRFPRQEYQSGLPFPAPRDLPNLGIKPASPALSEVK